MSVGEVRTTEQKRDVDAIRAATRMRHAGYAGPVADGYQAACWDCHWRSTTVTIDKAVARVEANEHEATAGPPPSSETVLALLGELDAQAARVRELETEQRETTAALSEIVEYTVGWGPR